MKHSFDVIIIGGGHAGCEAAAESAGAQSGPRAEDDPGSGAGFEDVPSAVRDRGKEAYSSRFVTYRRIYTLGCINVRLEGTYQELLEI